MFTPFNVYRAQRGLRIQAAIFGILFTLSGADGQQDAQLVFLGLAAGSLLLAEHWPPLAAALHRWIERHPDWQRATAYLPW